MLPFVGIVGVYLLGLWALSVASDLAGYALGSGLFLFTINFGLAYTFGLTAEVDNSGKLVVLSVGAIIGPMVAGRLLEGMGFNAMLGFSAGCSVISLAVYLLVIASYKRTAQYTQAVSA